MKYEPWFDTAENKALLAVSAWRMIRFFASCMALVALACIGIGIGMWAKSPLISRCCVGVGVLLLPACCYAWARPSAGSFLLLAVITAPFAFGLGILAVATDQWAYSWRMLVGSVGVALGVLVFHFYSSLKPLSQLIKSVSPEQVEHALMFQRDVFERRSDFQKNLVETDDRGDRTTSFRIQLMGDRALFVERRGSKIFTLPKNAVRSLISEFAEGYFRMRILHPLDTAVLQFDTENAEKIKAWLAAGDAQPQDAQVGAPNE